MSDVLKYKELVIKTLFVVVDENIGKRKQLVIGADHLEPHPGSQTERGYDGDENDEERDAAHGHFLGVLLVREMNTAFKSVVRLNG